jgi:hypothetical protein
MRLVWWWRWRCLLLVSLLVGLHIIEGLQHCLHKLILVVINCSRLTLLLVLLLLLLLGWPLHWLFLVFTIRWFGKEGK